MADKFCSSCQFWNPVFKSDKWFGICDHPMMGDKVKLDRPGQLHDEDTVMYTVQNFGCIYHLPADGYLVTNINLMHITKQTLLEKYLEMTGQTMKELMAGASQTGMDYIYDELLPQALEEKKKIVWVDLDLESGRGEYLLKDLD